MKTIGNKASSIHSGSITALIVCMILAFTAATVNAKPFRMRVLPENGGSLGCAACHKSPRGGKALNPFGEDYAKIGIGAGEKFTPELGELDSDGDGFANKTEFGSKTNPGDPQSKPATK